MNQAATGEHSSSAPEEVIAHQLSTTSEVRSLDSEWSEYLNHALGASIKFPKRVLANPYGFTDVTVPVKVIENGEIVTFSRGYVLNDVDGDEGVRKTEEDLKMRHPYFKSEYLNDLSYPYQIYLAKAESFADVKAFVKRVYGEGCTVIEEHASGHMSRPGYKGMVLEAENTSCKDPYSKGDYVQWYSNQKFVSALQTGWGGNFRIHRQPAIDGSESFYFEVLPISE